MLTQAQMAKLSVPQQELLAQLVLRKTRQREKLLAQARGRSFPFFIFGVFLLLLAVYSFDCFRLQENPRLLLLPVGMGLVFAVVFHITRMNRRLDALLELLDFDHAPPEPPEPPAADKMA